MILQNRLIPTVLYIIFSDENYNYYKLIAILISQIYQFLTNKASEIIEQISINENKSNISVSKSLKSHQLMLTNELANLKQGQGIVKISRYNPMKINLKLWKDLNLSEKRKIFKLK